MGKESQAPSTGLNQYVFVRLVSFRLLGTPLHVEGRILVQGVLSLVPPICPVWQLSFIWETSPLYSIANCLCSGFCVGPSRWLGCIMWLMSSGQSATGTKTCSGDPQADWRPANGEDTVTSEAVRCQTSLLIMHPDTWPPLEPICHRLCGVYTCRPPKNSLELLSDTLWTLGIFLKCFQRGYM